MKWSILLVWSEKQATDFVDCLVSLFFYLLEFVFICIDYILFPFSFFFLN